MSVNNSENEMTLEEACRLAREYQKEQRAMGKTCRWDQACLAIKRLYPQSLDAFAPKSAPSIRRELAR
jgi:hypothetical protein